MRILIIPARGGSKGIPKKNLKTVNGISLVERALRTALKSTVDQVIVSTDDQEVDCTIAVSIDDLKSLINGTLNPMGAFMMGKIKVKGDMGVAMKLQSLFKG